MELKQLETMSSSIKKPKKNLSAYMIFVQEVRPKVIEQIPGIKTLDVMKEIGKRWTNISQEDFAYYSDKASKDKIRYLAESKVFYDNVAEIAEKRAPTYA